MFWTTWKSKLNPSPGKGKGDMEMQLEDIIMSQEELNKMMEEGMKDREQGKPKEGEGEQKGKQGQKSRGEGDSEEMNGMLFEIYQKQQALRKALEERMAKDGTKGSGNDLLRKMEEVELELLNKGFTNETLNKMMELEHQLLKLENATLQQGEDLKREAKTATDRFNNEVNNQIPSAKKYFQTTEILNRNALPLKQNYKLKVQEYFKQRND
jgi:hypothetical protein